MSPPALLRTLGGMKNALLALALACSSCVTTGDLAELSMATDARFREALDAVEDYRAGAITEDEANARIDESKTALEEAFQEKAAEIEDRFRQLPPLPSSPLELVTWLAGLAGLAGYGGHRYTMARRDQARMARGEPTTPAPPSTPPASG